MVITSYKFNKAIKNKLKNIKAGCVTGPGRSGAIASVYASYILKIPWIPFGQPYPNKLKPILIIDTATHKGKTLKKAMKKYESSFSLAVFNEPPIIKFWYEKEE